MFNNITNLFYPSLCLQCNIHLFKHENILCTNCRHDLPLINIEDYQKNEILDVFYGFCSVFKAVSFLYFTKKGGVKKIIHQLKYKNNQEIGSLLGEWFGNMLKKSNEFSDIDFIVPVPLHITKLKQRGYNQLTNFGCSLSRILETDFEDSALIKIAISNTQTFKTRFERFADNEIKFRLIDENIFKNKHILLIDDVITTGATIEACCKELKKTENITISIATIAFTSQNS